MPRRKQKHAGFSLVELVIVIVVLGIIAAVAIPKITSGSRRGAEAALVANLKTMRDAIDWYYVEHNNTFPGAKSNGVGPNAGTADAFRTQLIEATNSQGWITGALATRRYGPYIRGQLPKLTVGTNAGKNTVTVLNQAAAPAVDVPSGTAWIYNVATGQIIPNDAGTAVDGTAYGDL